MAEELEVQTEDQSPVKEKVKSPRKLAIGLDVGTMHLVSSRSDSEDVRITRNMFLEVDPEEVPVSDLSNISYIEGDEGELYIIGEDSFRFSNIFNKEVSRPMKRGLIAADEIAAIDVLTLMIRDLIGNIKNTDAYCTYSVPAEAIDESRSVVYHERVFGRILSSLGVNHKPLNEAMAIIYSECQKEKFSGIAISFGAGMANVILAFKGIEALKFSTARSGDWIDQNVAESLGTVPNRVTSVKESSLDLELGFAGEKNKKKKRVLEALTYYYESLINYTIKRIISEFNEKVDMEIDEKIPLVVSGGTSMVPGFVTLFKSVLSRYDLPFELSEIRSAKNPLTAVSQGLLIKTLADIG